MTTTNKPASSRTGTPKITPAEIGFRILVGVFLMTVLGLAAVLVTYGIQAENGHGTRVVSMQESLRSHGFTTDDTLAERMVNECRGAAPANDATRKLTTASIIEEHNGVKSVITLVCDGNASISDFSVTPGS